MPWAQDLEQKLIIISRSMTEQTTPDKLPARGNILTYQTLGVVPLLTVSTKGNVCLQSGPNTMLTRILGECEKQGIERGGGVSATLPPHWYRLLQSFHWWIHSEMDEFRFQVRRCRRGRVSVSTQSPWNDFLTGRT